MAVAGWGCSVRMGSALHSKVFFMATLYSSNLAHRCELGMYTEKPFEEV